MKHSEIIADILDNTRNLSKWYIAKLDEDKLYKMYQLGDMEFNNAYWVVAHMAWAEQDLVLEATGGKKLDISWLNDFAMKSKCEAEPKGPSWKEVLSAFDQVHEASLLHIRKLDDSSLETSLETMEIFKTRKLILYHAIRHEGVHIGHLSWINKMMGSPTP